MEEVGDGSHSDNRRGVSPITAPLIPQARALRGSGLFWVRSRLTSIDLTLFLKNVPEMTVLQDMPIGLCTMCPTFGRMRTMFQGTRIQGVPSASLEGLRACAGEGAYCICKKVVAAE